MRVLQGWGGAAGGKRALAARDTTVPCWWGGVRVGGGGRLQNIKRIGAQSAVVAARTWFSRNTLDCLSSASTSVVLPWSTCAMMAMLRMSARGEAAASPAAAGAAGRVPGEGGGGGGLREGFVCPRGWLRVGRMIPRCSRHAVPSAWCHPPSGAATRQATPRWAAGEAAGAKAAAADARERPAVAAEGDARWACGHPASSCGQWRPGLLCRAFRHPLRPWLRPGRPRGQKLARRRNRPDSATSH